MTERTSPNRGGLVVALDGPSSSGKSSVGAEAAVRLGYGFCDTGLLYRAVAWLAMERGVDPSDVAALVSLAAEVTLLPDERGRYERVSAAGRDVTSAVHGAAVDGRVSEFARVPELRAALVDRQRDLAAHGAIVMAGRDIGTVILPDADVKIYLDASAEARAHRRAVQRDMDAASERRVLDELRRRDEIDSSREAAPLRIARGSIVVNSDDLTQEQTVEAVVGIIRSVEAGRSVGGPA